MTGRAETIRLHERRERDPWLYCSLVVVALALGGAVYATARHDLFLGFADAASHVVIPRRVFDNVDPGLPQLGTHWGPLFHLLQLPFVWLTPLYQSGASGAIVSGAAALVTTAYVYRLGRLVELPGWQAFAGAALLATTPSFAYSGVVPMLPAAVMATATANVYYLTRWTMTGSARALLLGGLALCAATLTHFDTWILAPVELILIAGVAYRRRRAPREVEATLAVWFIAGGYGILLFLLMNLLIFGELLAFTQGFHGTGDVLEASHHGMGALLDYPRAVWVMAGPVLTAAGAFGLGLYVWRSRGTAGRLVPLLLLYPLAWYTVQAATAGSLIEPGESLGDWRNLRYATTALPAFAFFAIAGLRRAVAVTAVACAVLLAASISVATGDVAAWEDAKQDVPNRDVIAAYAQQAADAAAGRQILIPVHHSRVDRFELSSGLDSRAFVDGNDTYEWRLARDPDSRWLRAERRRFGAVVWMGSPSHPDARIARRAVRTLGAVRCSKGGQVALKKDRIRVYATRGC